MVTIKISESKINKIKEICQRFNHDEGELINILHAVQSEFGYLPAEVQEIIAKELRISVAKIYGIVTFYSFFTMTPKGQYPINVCMGTACYVRGAEKVLEELKKQLNIKIGECTPDGKFSINCLRCVGACGLAPVVMIGEKTYGRIAPEQVKDILDEYK